MERFQFIFFISDLLFFIVMLLFVAYIVYAKRKAHLIKPWQRLAQRPVAVICGFVLLLFMIIALLDSIHIQFLDNYKLYVNSRVYSVLDIVLAPLGQISEETYSSPFATHAYASATGIDRAGNFFEYYPPLKFKYHIFGTDQVGQDLFYITLKSIRTSIFIGTLTTIVLLPFSIFLGMCAGYFSGWIDDVIQYIYITLSSIPGVLLISAAILSAQIFITSHPDFFSSMEERADTRLLILCVILGITSWTGLCRLLRAETLKIKEMEYIHAAIALGSSHARILLTHILPNIFHIIIISVVLDFSGLVLAEAVLSYVGVGVDPLTPSFGNTINAARMEMAREPMVWWPLVASFVFMFVLVLSANIFSDKLRESFDPKYQKNGWLNKLLLARLTKR